MTTNRLAIKAGEAKTLTLTVTDEDGAAVNLSAATLLLGAKRAKSDTAYSISKENAAFDKSLAASGIVTVALSGTDTNLAEGIYVGELKCIWTGPPAITEKSADFYLQIKAAVTA